MPLPAVGTAAPDFTLPSTAGESVTLSKLRGENVLLAFFPLAFTSVCTKELCAFTDDYSQFQSAGTVVLPISVDSVPTLKEYKSKERIGLDLLSDFKREVSRTYGTLGRQVLFQPRLHRHRPARESSAGRSPKTLNREPAGEWVTTGRIEEAGLTGDGRRETGYF
jgi:peroxiredoxin